MNGRPWTRGGLGGLGILVLGWLASSTWRIWSPAWRTDPSSLPAGWSTRYTVPLLGGDDGPLRP